MTVESARGAVGADIRARIDHPIIDGDGHVQECAFAMPDFLKKAGGPDILKRWEKHRKAGAAIAVKTAVWNVPSGKATIDRAMVMLPKLYKERLDEAGIDFSVIYTTLGLGLLDHPDDELRRAGCRALNMMNWDLFAPVSDRMTPSALIPMNTPEEAIDELEFSVNELGFKSVMVCSETATPVPEIEKEAPHLAPLATRIRSLSVESPHDYDPVWRKCADLKVAVACHNGSRGGGGRRASENNFVFNHIGNFANGSEFFCRSLFMGGVSRRFPELNFAFLEGGVGWAVNLFNDIVWHWEKRNVDAMKEYLDPGKLDMDLMVEMFEKYGNDYLTPERMRGYPEPHNSRLGGDPAVFDDWEACKIEKKEDLSDLFIPNFYIGAEADDRMTPVAFIPKLNYFGAKVKAFLGTDIGHWDVQNALHCVNQAYEPVEEGLMTEDDFRDFVFTNIVNLHARVNPDFYKGTAVEEAADQLMASQKAAA